jgi:lysophospholipid acyltransferase (LPLAT)-like uncharacterized protein
MDRTAEKEAVPVHEPAQPMVPSPRGDRRARRRGPLARFFRRKLRPMFSRRLSRLASVVVPVLYMIYMRLVWATSRIEGRDFVALKQIIAQHNGAVGLLWHEEVMTVAFGYYYLGFQPHTLASIGESGEVIARMLARCGFVVFRGGSTTGRSRRREGALDEMITHMRTHDEVIYGLTVDGSKGPPYRMKTGGIIIARECGKPVVLARTWYKRCVRLPTWDRMAVPLPFNVIRYYLRGPYQVPENARDAAGLEEFRLRLENDLIDLAAQSYADMGQARPANLVKRQPLEPPLTSQADTR